MVISILLQNKLLISINLSNVCFFIYFFLSLYSYCIFVVALQWSFEFLVNWFDFEKPLILLKPIGQVWIFIIKTNVIFKQVKLVVNKAIKKYNISGLKKDTRKLDVLSLTT
jgi:hypothetical protein